MQVRRDGDRYEVAATEWALAPVEAVFDLLADLEAHMEWGGSWQPTRTQRLQSLAAPPGPATVGVEFRSVGSASGGSWHDRSLVTESVRPSVFEFKTEGILKNGQGNRMSLGAVHRYELTQHGERTKIDYALRANLEVLGPPGDEHPRLPVVVFGLVVPAVIERGLNNLIRMAESTDRAGS